MNELEPTSTKLRETLASSSVKHILVLAKKEAKRVRSTFIDTGLLLWAIAKESKEAAGVLSEMGVTGKNIMLDIKPASLSRPVKSVEIELTALCEDALTKAFDIANSYRSNQVNSLHLLLALLSIEGGMGKGALTRMGIDLEDLDVRIKQLITASLVA